MKHAMKERKERKIDKSMITTSRDHCKGKFSNDYVYDGDDPPIDYESIERFLDTGRVEDLSKNSHLGPNMILQITKRYTKHLQECGDMGYYRPPNARVFMVMVKNSIQAEVEEIPPKPPEPEVVVHDVASSQPDKGETTIAELAAAYFARNNEEAERIKQENEAKEVEKEITKEDVKAMLDHCNVVELDTETSTYVQGKVKSKRSGKPILPCSFGKTSFYRSGSRFRG
jgi:hypothetical protein